MDKQREVHRMHSVFDILNYRSMLVPNRSSIRVLFEYDAGAGKKVFKILTGGIPEETCRMLSDMLQSNVESDRIIYGLESNNLDYESITKGMAQ